MIKGIVFDLDDTLYPLEEYLESGFRAVARYAGEKYGIDPEESYAYMKILYTRYGEKEVLARTVCYFNLESSAIIELIAVFREHPPIVALYPDYRKTLAELAVRFRLGILADGDPDVQGRILRALRIQKHFQSVIFTGKYDEAKWKPNPFCFTLTARILRCHPRELVYVGDNPLTDFLGAKKAGFYTMRVLTGPLRDKIVPMEFDADAQINDITQIREVINEQFD